MRLAVYLGERPERDLREIFDFYRLEVRNPARGYELVNAPGKAMLKLGERQIGRRSDGLPVNFRRTAVEKHIIFYTINQAAGKRPSTM